MPDFGPFTSYRDALMEACPLILSQPRATAGRRDDQNFAVRWRVSTEYCAWLYHTPQETYEMSMLMESSDAVPPDSHGERGCRIPAFVHDRRYPQHALKHLYVLHNHPAAPTHISLKDIRAVVAAAKIHGRFMETHEGRIPVGVVAFFANSYEPTSPSCDGFFEYTWGSTDVVRWTPDEQGAWSGEKVGTVTWKSETEFDFEPGG